jgi:hypothetical protein
MAVQAKYRKASPISLVRNPSMTFIAIRANDGEGQSIEDYLARLRLN